MNFLKVEGHDDLARLKDSGAVIMTDSEKYQEFMRTYHAKKAQKEQEANAIEERFQRLEQQQQENNDLLRQILGALNVQPIQR